MAAGSRRWDPTPRVRTQEYMNSRILISSMSRCHQSLRATPAIIGRGGDAITISSGSSSSGSGGSVVP